jgi:glycosyltransferase involved in cell wall biosynthesis
MGLARRPSRDQLLNGEPYPHAGVRRYRMAACKPRSAPRAAVGGPPHADAVSRRRLVDRNLQPGVLYPLRYAFRRIWPGVCPADTALFGQARASRERTVKGEVFGLRIGYAGKLITSKGVDELIRACSLLPRDRAWSLTVVGDGPLMADLTALAGQLHIDDRVSFRGFANASEMPKLLGSFDVVVPSRSDMRVLVSIEATAAGAAIVVSDATALWGPGDLVADGVTGLVYRSGDPAGLARQLAVSWRRRAWLRGSVSAAPSGPPPSDPIRLPRRPRRQSVLTCMIRRSPGLAITFPVDRKVLLRN